MDAAQKGCPRGYPQRTVVYVGVVKSDVSTDSRDGVRKHVRTVLP